ncbi:MAG: hypothetical protein SCARUB_04713 [Candidatus Scalindua rubra]|uniref:Uncharacterized protein n=1 Tax=Candidatus Scalindua rubra TaxID=1872076 RepID=A0A1E3X3F0_9BACT|nr:MAG: hypothetical protein SCARUB_04713 [Candidatus Scalindua rubra]
MTMMIWIIIGLLIFILWLLIAIVIGMYSHSKDSSENIINLEKRLKAELSHVKDCIKRLEEPVFLTEDEKKSLFFTDAQDLSIFFFLHLKEGQIVNLMCNIVYSDVTETGIATILSNDNIVKFQYKHDSTDMGEISVNEWKKFEEMRKNSKDKISGYDRMKEEGGEVSGFYRLSINEKWKPMSLRIKNTECYVVGDAFKSITGSLPNVLGNAPTSMFDSIVVKVKAPCRKLKTYNEDGELVNIEDL